MARGGSWGVERRCLGVIAVSRRLAGVSADGPRRELRRERSRRESELGRISKDSGAAAGQQ